MNEPAEILDDQADVSLAALVDSTMARTETSAKADRIRAAIEADAEKVAAIDAKLAARPDDEERSRPGKFVPNTPGKWGGLTPQEAAIKSHQARRERALEILRDSELAKAISNHKVINAPSRDELRGVAAAVIFDLGHQILAGTLPVKNAGTAAKVIDTFFNILRLESNQSTANVEHLSIEEKRKMIQEMRDAAQERKAQILDLPATDP